MRTLLFISLILSGCALNAHDFTGDDRIQDQGENYFSTDITLPVSKRKLRDYYSGIAEKPVIIQDQLIFMNLNGRLEMLNLKTKFQSGTYKFNFGSKISPLVDYPNLFIALGVNKRNLHRYQLEAETVEWSINIPMGIESKPTHHGDLVVVASMTGVVYGVKKVDGSIVWKTRLPKSVYADLQMLDGEIIVPADDGTIYRLNPTDGKIISHKSVTNAPIRVKPAIFKSKIFVADIKGTLTIVDRRSGEVDTRLTFTQPFRSEMAFDATHVYISNNDGHLYKIDAAGNIVWKFSTKTVVFAQPLIGEKFVYVGNAKGELFMVDKATGKSEYSDDLKGHFNSSPVFWKDKLIVFPDNDDILIYEEKIEQADD